MIHYLRITGTLRSLICCDRLLIIFSVYPETVRARPTTDHHFGTSGRIHRSQCPMLSPMISHIHICALSGNFYCDYNAYSLLGLRMSICPPCQKRNRSIAKCEKMRCGSCVSKNLGWLIHVTAAVCLRLTSPLATLRQNPLKEKNMDELSFKKEGEGHIARIRLIGTGGYSTGVHAVRVVAD